MVERTPEALAQAYHDHLSANPGSANLMARDEDEAAAVAARLRKLGWRAKAEMGLQGWECKPVHYIRVGGRSKRRG